MIAEALKGKTILVTGSTGFLGKSIVEKCLRSVPEIARIHLAIRSSARRPASERLEREVLSSPAFKRLKEELGEDAFARLAAQKLDVIEIDLGRDGLGLTDEARDQLRACDVVIHSAAAVEFDNPADLSAQTNLLGAARLVEALKASGARPHLVHISTAFVGGMLRGVVREESPLDPGLNWRHEAQVLSGLRGPVEQESRRPEVLSRLRREATSRMGPAGTPAVARATERLRDRWVKDRLIERGRVHANSMGFSDIYSFTKAMAEHAVVELHGDIPLSIVRPSIIESALAEPFAGWLEGFRMAEPLILAFGRNILRDFSGLPDSLLDVIPADFVVNTVLAVAANPPPDAKPRVYHAASGSRNPLRFRRIVDEARTYFTAHPLRDRFGQAIGTPSWTYPTRQEMATRARTALRVVEAAQWFVERLPLGASTASAESTSSSSTACIPRSTASSTRATSRLCGSRRRRPSARNFHSIPRCSTGRTTSRTSTFRPLCACHGQRRRRAEASSPAAARPPKRSPARCGRRSSGARDAVTCWQCSTSTARSWRPTSSSTSCGCACAPSRLRSGRRSWPTCS